MLGNDQELLEQFVQDVRADLIADAETQGRMASGNARRQMRTEADNDTALLIDGAGYTEWGWFYGRKPGKFPPIADILQWIEDKRLVIRGSKKSAAFLIARAIANRGTVLHQDRGSGILETALTESRLTALTEALGSKYATEVASDIARSFKFAA